MQLFICSSISDERYHTICMKNEGDRTDADKKFLEYFMYIRTSEVDDVQKVTEHEQNTEMAEDPVKKVETIDECVPEVESLTQTDEACEVEALIQEGEAPKQFEADESLLDADEAPKQVEEASESLKQAGEVSKQIEEAPEHTADVIDYISNDVESAI